MRERPIPVFAEMSSLNPVFLMPESIEVRGDSIALVSDARMRALNRQYRGKDYATDVLSFVAPGPSDPSDPSDRE